MYVWPNLIWSQNWTTDDVIHLYYLLILSIIHDPPFLRFSQQWRHEKEKRETANYTRQNDALQSTTSTFIMWTTNCFLGLLLFLVLLWILTLFWLFQFWSTRRLSLDLPVSVLILSSWLYSTKRPYYIVIADSSCFGPQVVRLSQQHPPRQDGERCQRPTMTKQIQPTVAAIMHHRYRHWYLSLRMVLVSRIFNLPTTIAKSWIWTMCIKPLKKLRVCTK